MPAVRAYVGLGSNLDDPERQITRALTELTKLPHTRFIKHSSLYLSAPLGPAGQPDYVNAVALLETALSAKELLKQLLEIEHRHGRIRTREQWGPRTLDLDLLLYGDLHYADPSLTVPHPRLHERAFVLYPLAELDPGLQIPGKGTLQELIKHCPKQKLTPLPISL